MFATEKWGKPHDVSWTIVYKGYLKIYAFCRIKQQKKFFNGLNLAKGNIR